MARRSWEDCGTNGKDGEKGFSSWNFSYFEMSCTVSPLIVVKRHCLFLVGVIMNFQSSKFAVSSCYSMGYSRPGEGVIPMEGSNIYGFMDHKNH